ncbi:LpqN/LpqT family lipoprotein [Mycobacterium sp. 141]|uniref:LpqN/LpqT family lipoprotein n=1 Tax=Mycobacterium sp. 141 TaxID=1120797 RepID=UPI000369E181|nr:LpqN/LpqT family lipoprotein [Mycobacterium sp. 141]
MTAISQSLRAGGIAVAAVALAISLVGCGSGNKSQDTSKSTSTESSTATTTMPDEQGPSGEPSPAAAAGPNYTIVDYIRDNNLVETAVHRGDPGTPTLDLPVPSGWSSAGDKMPDWAWDAIVSDDPEFAADPPSVIALMSRLTGNVDPAKILEYAPNEIKNLPGYEAMGDGASSTLGGFQAFQFGGGYVREGVKRVIAQKTVVIPGQGGLYVLQLNADGLEDQMGALLDATAMIDEQTTITP